MSRVIYQWSLERLEDLTENIRILHLHLKDPAEFKFKAGQFVMLHVPQEPKPALRAYSIASAEQESKYMRLILKYVEGGVASKYVWSLQGGEILNFTGPFGKVFFQEPPTEQIVFMNTGSGVAQHICYLLSKMEQYPNLHYKLLFGVRNESDIYMKDELEELKHKLPNFQYEFVLSRGPESWTGKRGYVQNFIEEFDYMNKPTTFYLCGNGAMIKDTKAALAAKNFDPKRIWVEAFD